MPRSRQCRATSADRLQRAELVLGEHQRHEPRLRPERGDDRARRNHAVRRRRDPRQRGARRRRPGLGRRRHRGVLEGGKDEVPPGTCSRRSAAATTALLASVPEAVKTTSAGGSAPSSAATSARAASTPRARPVPPRARTTDCPSARRARAASPRARGGRAAWWRCGRSRPRAWAVNPTSGTVSAGSSPDAPSALRPPRRRLALTSRRPNRCAGPKVQSGDMRRTARVPS